MKKTVLFLLLAFFLISFNSTEIPAGINGSLASDLTDYLRKIAEEKELAGLCIAITSKEEIIYSNAFGVRNIESGELMKEEYFFHMASVSKPFVATAVMQLVEQGKIDLDEKVTSYLPYFSLDDERYTDIRIRNMLNHTSGMPDVEDYEWDKTQYDEGAAERYVRSISNEKMLFDTGEGFRYSNMAFDVMGDVIAKVSGMSFDDYVKTNILDPLNMTHSDFRYPEIPEELRTSPHVNKDGKIAVSKVYPYNRRHAPSSTLNSSVIEMSRWARANLNRGELEGRRILEDSSYEVLWTNSVTGSDQARVGLSWFLNEYKGHPTIDHGGGDTGYRSYITLIPEKDLALILAANYDRTPIQEIREGVLDIIFEHVDMP